MYLYILILFLLIFLLLINIGMFQLFKHIYYYQPNNVKHTQNKLLDVILMNDTIVTSVYLDDRINSYRLILYHEESYFPNNISCKYEYKDNRSENCSYIVKSYKAYKSEFFHLLVRINNMNELPKYLYLNSKKMTLPIPYTGGYKYNLTVCITILIDYKATNRLIQLIESYKYFGVDHFTIYKISGSIEVERVLEYYENEGLIEIITWNKNIELSIRMKENAYYGQRNKLNDCIYRNMKKSKRIITSDLDEIIWPTKGKSIMNMLNKFDKKNRFNTYYFRSAYFHSEESSLNFDLLCHAVNDINIFAYREYCIFKRRYVAKYILTKPNVIYSSFIHFIDKGTSKLKTIDIPVDYGFIRHIRSFTYTNKEYCASKWMIYPKDEREDEIMINVNKTIYKLNITIDISSSKPFIIGSKYKYKKNK